MAEENKNLEIQKAKKGSWLFRIGLVSLVLTIGLISKSFTYTEVPEIGFFFILMSIPLGVLGVVLILIHDFLKFGRKEPLSLADKIIILFFILILIVIIYWLLLFLFETR